MISLGDRNEEKFRARIMGEAQLLVEKKIRESGDRGTSILNFLTNLVAFLAVNVLLMQEKGKSKEMIHKILEDYFSGKGMYFDLMKEGDDGQHFFTKDYMGILFFVEKGRPQWKSFGEEFYSMYKELGLKIEPQGVDGEVMPSRARRADLNFARRYSCSKEE